jgi:hypothetical protein
MKTEAIYRNIVFLYKNIMVLIDIKGMYKREQGFLKDGDISRTLGLLSNLPIVIESPE